jgi:hypothetical protein
MKKNQGRKPALSNRRSYYNFKLPVTPADVHPGWAVP